LSAAAVGAVHVFTACEAALEDTPRPAETTASRSPRDQEAVMDNRSTPIVAAALLAVVAAGCHTSKVHLGSGEPAHPAVHERPYGGPPAHAPAHGYHKKFAYTYYPDAGVYYAADRNLYFWMEGEEWKVGVSLPRTTRLDTSTGVSVELASDTPYVHHSEMVRTHGSGGPGAAKGKHKGRAKGHARGR
jgi:hypothetical protein